MKKAAKIFAAVAALTTLASCAPEFNPPLGYTGGFLWDSGKSRTVTVEAGDTLATISRRYNVPTQVIIARNGLAAPYALTVAQELILDPARSHLVVRGDTLSQLAATYSVEMRLIADANDLSPPYLINIGQSLWIPDPFTQAAASAGKAASTEAAQIAAAAPPPPIPAPRAPRAAITEDSLAPPPGSAQPSTIFGVPPITPIEPAPALAAPTATAPQPETEVAIALPPQPLTEPAGRASARFAWPVVGKVIAAYGAAGEGLHNDGINIAAKEGTEVHAADNGVVAYAGNELKGFGNLLLLKHADGWATAYAHNDKLLVKRGDEVRQGQVIAVVGRTGSVDTPQLHFEVRKGTQALDPMNYLAE